MATENNQVEQGICVQMTVDVTVEELRARVVGEEADGDLIIHIMTQKLANVLVKAHVQFCLTARESPCGPIERSGVSCAWAH